MAVRKTFNPTEALEVATSPRPRFRRRAVLARRVPPWMEVELEHGRRDPATNVTGDDPLTTGKFALAHLREMKDYYTRLARMEAEAKTEVAEAMDPA